MIFFNTICTNTQLSENFVINVFLLALCFFVVQVRNVTRGSLFILFNFYLKYYQQHLTIHMYYFYSLERTYYFDGHHWYSCRSCRGRTHCVDSFVTKMYEEFHCPSLCKHVISNNNFMRM